MGELETTVADATSAPSYESALALEPGDMVGRYRVLGRLGAGGMGVVYRAHDPTLDREVAIKLLRYGGGVTDTATVRLLREARALARLSHPNVLPVYDVGTVEGSVYLALELVQGRDLRQWLRTPRSLDAILDRFDQAGRGLMVAHAAGLVHRDFKPDNVLVGEDGRVRVMDFGLVLHEESSVSVATPSGHGEASGAAFGFEDALTEVGTVMGTPAYMAPEQHRADPLDAACDQYAFCVSLFEALHGQRPFAAKSTRALVKRKLAMDVAQTSRTDVPERIAAAILRGLSPQPDDRWPSMEALLETLSPRGRRRWPWWLAGASVVVGGAVAVAMLHPVATPACDAKGRLDGIWDDDARERVRTSILATSAAYAQDTWARVEPTLDARAAQWSAQYQASCEAEPADRDRQQVCLGQHRDHLATVVTLLGSTDVAGVRKALSTVGALAAVDCTVARDPALPAEPALASTVLALRQQLFEARALDRAGRQQDAETRLAQVVTGARAAGFEPFVARALQVQGTVLVHGQQPSAAIEPLEEAYSLATAASHDRVAAESAIQLVTLYGDVLARHDQVEAWVEHARAALDRAPRDDEQRARLASSTGSAYFRQQRLPDAARELTEAVSVLRGIDDDVRQPLASALSSLGTVRFASGDPEGAGECFEEALALLEQEFGPQHPILTTAIMNTGNLAQSRGETEAALAAYRRAISLVEASYGEGHEKLAGPLNNIGFALMQRGDFDEGEAYLRRAVEIWSRALGPEHPNVALPLAVLAEHALDEGRYEAARVELARALRILEAAMGEGSPGTLETKALLGWALMGLGREEEAGEHLSVVQGEAEQPSTPPFVRASLHALMSKAYWPREPAVAVGYAQKALTHYEAVAPADSPEAAALREWLREHPVPDAGPPTGVSP